MKSHHVVNRVLYLSGHVPEGPEGVHPGRLGRDVTIEEGYQAARQTGLNCLAGIRYAVGSLDRVQGLVRNLFFVAAAPDFTDVHLVSSGCSDLLRDVFGPEAGLGGRATIGVQSLAHDHCFECWLEVELLEDPCLTASPTQAAPTPSLPPTPPHRRPATPSSGAAARPSMPPWPLPPH